MEMDRRKNFILYEWAPECGTPDNEYTESEGAETLILVIRFSDQNNEIFSAVMGTYSKHKQVAYCCNSFKKNTGAQLEERWLRDYKDNKFFLIDGLLYHKEKNIIALIVIDGDHI
ncbi:hypothetical protein O181_117909 [Austropuccinia psidii MF-1]|uniref:Uncharacterized protein n=1 Tax=Austropuccinia psidii MF-1 TaxID=1389203 RepID=A0A9Q3PXZ0_9BASI|nr:hypothetical protein [Austropuccinia psidii MF-1]